jgi:hypothetical protein
MKLYTENEIRNLIGIEPPLEPMLPCIDDIDDAMTVRIYYRGKNKYIIKSVKNDSQIGFSLTFEDLCGV